MAKGNSCSLTIYNAEDDKKFRPSELPRGRLETKVKNKELKPIVEVDPSQSTSEISLGFRMTITVLSIASFIVLGLFANTKYIIEMEPFLGKRYKLKTSEKFDEYMQFLEIGFVTRKAAATLNPVCILTRNDDGSYTFTAETAIRNNAVTFKLNEEFEEERADGAKTKSLVVMDGNKLIHTQTEANGRKSTHERVFTADLLTVISTTEGWPDKCVRTFVPV